MNPVTRRSVMAGSAAVVAAVPAFGLTKGVDGPSELAALVKRYFEQIAIFNDTRHETDDEFDAHAAATFEPVMDAMQGTPVRSEEDALAVVDILIRENCVDWHWAEGMVEELHAYLATRVA